MDKLNLIMLHLLDDISSRCSLEIIDPYYNEYTNINSSIKLGGNWTLGYPLRTLNLNFNKDENGNKNTPVTNHLFKDRNAISSSKTLTNFTRLRVHSGGNAFEESIGFNDALLQGLMDTDGWCSKKRSPQFCTISESLKNDVIWIARSLGYNVRCIKKKSGYRRNSKYIQGSDSYIITICGGEELFNLL